MRFLSFGNFFCTFEMKTATDSNKGEEGIKTHEDLSTPYTKIDQSQWEFVFYARNQSQKRRRSERNTVNFTILPPSSSSSSSAAAARWTSNEFMNGGAERVKRVIEFVFFFNKEEILLLLCVCVCVYGSALNWIESVFITTAAAAATTTLQLPFICFVVVPFVCCAA